MKTLWTGFALLAVVMYAPAQDQGAKGRLVERFEELNLTEDQEESGHHAEEQRRLDYVRHRSILRRCSVRAARSSGL